MVPATHDARNDDDPARHLTKVEKREADCKSSALTFGEATDEELMEEAKNAENEKYTNPRLPIGVLIGVEK